jgi:hypothetical protein
MFTFSKVPSTRITFGRCCSSSQDPFSAFCRWVLAHTKKWQHEIFNSVASFVCIMTLPRICATLLLSIPLLVCAEFSVSFPLYDDRVTIRNEKRAEHLMLMMSQPFNSSICRTWEKSFFVFTRPNIVEEGIVEIRAAKSMMIPRTLHC